MVCRTEYHGSRSHEDVERIRKEVEELTGKGYLLVPDSSIEEYIDATIELARTNEPHHTVRYAPRYQEDLPHILGYEAGHVLRFYRAPEEWQMFPKITDEHRERVRYELGDYLLKLARKGMPPEGMDDLLKVWHEGTVRQISNTAVDMRIERWLHEDYDGLRPVQRRMLRRQTKENARGLHRMVKSFTPEKVYHASTTMNSAFASYLGWLLRDRKLRQPYLKTPYCEAGEGLAKLVWETEDEGHNRISRQSTCGLSGLGLPSGLGGLTYCKLCVTHWRRVVMI